MSYAIALTGGEGDGAWFEGHALEGAPERIRVAIAIDGRISLLDLPDDELELGEREVIYRRRSLGHVCARGGKHRGCHAYATYEPARCDREAGTHYHGAGESCDCGEQPNVVSAAPARPTLTALEGGADG